MATSQRGGGGEPFTIVSGIQLMNGNTSKAKGTTIHFQYCSIFKVTNKTQMTVPIPQLRVELSLCVLDN